MRLTSARREPAVIKVFLLTRALSSENHQCRWRHKCLNYIVSVSICSLLSDASASFISMRVNGIAGNVLCVYVRAAEWLQADVCISERQVDLLETSLFIPAAAARRFDPPLFVLQGPRPYSISAEVSVWKRVRLLKHTACISYVVKFDIITHYAHTHTLI